MASRIQPNHLRFLLFFCLLAVLVVVLLKRTPDRSDAEFHRAATETVNEINSKEKAQIDSDTGIVTLKGSAEEVEAMKRKIDEKLNK